MHSVLLVSYFSSNGEQKYMGENSWLKTSLDISRESCQGCSGGPGWYKPGRESSCATRNCWGEDAAEGCELYQEGTWAG